jgi:Carboxypeptidase regulatory-like domain/TonB-dependent Receptor Plug Domain
MLLITVQESSMPQTSRFPSWLIVIFCLLTLSFAAHAQTTVDGAIVGTVFDNAGAAVPNATLTIQNNATNAVITVVSDKSGNYSAPLLQPGTYTVSVTAEGFAPYRSTGVIVLIGQPTEVDAHLGVGSVVTSVQVSAAAPLLNFESPDFSGVISQQTRSNLPINNRRWSALAMTTPGVVSDSNGYGLVSVRGISTLLNNVLIDGADDNQAYYSEERGRTREAYSTSGSAVQEFQMNTGVYSAEYGRAAGGVINSVTKSGSNKLHGEAYFWDRESNWASYNDFSKIAVLNPTTSTYTETPLKPEDLRKIYGFTAGGPLIKDKLFWIYTYDQHTHVFPGVGVPSNPSSFYSLPSAAVPAGETCNDGSTGNGYYSGGSSTLDGYVCTMAARQSITYAAAASAYDSAISALSADLGTVPRFGYQEINTPKLDWQINDKEHLSLLYHRLRWDSPGGVQTNSTADYALDTWGNDFVKLDYGLATLTSLLRSNLSNQLLYQYGRELDDEGQQPFTQYTTNNLVGTGGNIPEVGLDTSIGFNLGSPYYSYRKALPDEHKWQITDTLYDSWGNHSLKFGADFVHNADLINNTYESNGDYSYSYITNYVTDLLNKGNATSTCNSTASPSATSAGEARSSIVGTYPCYADYYQGFGPPVFSISTLDYAFFAQDNWRFSPRLTLELGLRYDYEFLPGPVSDLTTATGTFVPYQQLMNNPSDKNNFGPRVGFAYDVSGQGKTVFRGGVGMYYGRITNGNLLNARLETGSPNGQYTTTYKASTAGNPDFPNPVTTTGAAPKPSSYYLASNLQNPLVYEYDLMVQQEIGTGNIFQVSYLGALGRELPNYLDFNLNPATTNSTITVADPTGKGPLPNGTVFTVPTYTSYGNTNLFGAAAADYQSITQVSSNVNSNYNALVIEAQNHSLRDLLFDVNWTWSHALDYAQNADTTLAGNTWYDPYRNPRLNYGNSSFNVPERFVAYAVYTTPNIRSESWAKYFANGWSVSDSFQRQSGLPYTASVSGYVGDAILSDWNGASGSAMIPEIGLNTYKYPRKTVDDARLQKDIPFKEGIHLQLMANVFNIANHQNYDGISTTAYKLSTNAGSTTAGTATFQGGQSGQGTFGEATSSNDSGFLYTPREIEISSRLIF